MYDGIREDRHREGRERFGRESPVEESTPWLSVRLWEGLQLSGRLQLYIRYNFTSVCPPEGQQTTTYGSCCQRLGASSRRSIRHIVSIIANTGSTVAPYDRTANRRVVRRGCNAGDMGYVGGSDGERTGYVSRRTRMELDLTSRGTYQDNKTPMFGTSSARSPWACRCRGSGRRLACARPAIAPFLA